jgi:hypothetical protein
MRNLLNHAAYRSASRKGNLVNVGMTCRAFQKATNYHIDVYLEEPLE